MSPHLHRHKNARIGARIPQNHGIRAFDPIFNHIYLFHTGHLRNLDCPKDMAYPRKLAKIPAGTVSFRHGLRDLMVSAANPDRRAKPCPNR